MLYDAYSEMGIDKILPNIERRQTAFSRNDVSDFFYGDLAEKFKNFQNCLETNIKHHNQKPRA